MDESTVELLAYIDEVRRGRCVCGYDQPHTFGRRDFVTLDAYAALLESRELDAAGYVRCAGWAPSQNRRCAQRGYDGQPLRASISECCAHPGVWLDRGPIGEWFCERHGG